MNINKCKICGQMDSVYIYLIKNKTYKICEICSDTIMLVNIQNNLTTKWKTCRELKEMSKNEK